jgi:hypothetical protein
MPAQKLETDQHGFRARARERKARMSDEKINWPRLTDQEFESAKADAIAAYERAEAEKRRKLIKEAAEQLEIDRRDAEVNADGD